MKKEKKHRNFQIRRKTDILLVPYIIVVRLYLTIKIISFVIKLVLK